MIGVGIGLHRPRPPNRTGGFLAYGSPVGGFFIETVSLIARPCEARTARHSRRRYLASFDAVAQRRQHAFRPRLGFDPRPVAAVVWVSAPCLTSSALPVLLCSGMVFTRPPSCPAFP